VYVKNLSLALRNLGHHVEVVSGPPDLCLDADIPLHQLPCLDLFDPQNPFRIPTVKELSKPVNLLEWIGVSTMGFPEPLVFGIRAYQFLRDRLHRYDVIHDNQSLSYGIWAISRRVPTLATVHHPITVDRDIAVKETGPWWEKMKQLRWFSFIGMQKKVARTFHRIITVSHSAGKDISREFGIPPERFRIAPNGIDTDLFHPMPEIPREKTRIIVTNSADTPLKGLCYLLEAVARIAKDRKIHLVVIGEPKKNGIIEKMVRSLEIGHSVTFTGRVDERRLVQEYAKAAVAVIPSVYEGFGLPAGEAMACGVPVISTTGGALPEVVGDAGVLVPPADHDALSRAITDLLDHPERAQHLGKAGFERVLSHFTWQRAAEKTVSAYREVIGDHR
jgi:glycosyltransferase involved in cell wall biosynthesis